MDTQKKKIVVIGGDAAGMSAASQVKRLRPAWEVVVFEQGDYISYAACGMPYFIQGLIENKDQLIELTAQTAIEKRNLDVRLNHKVIKIMPQEKSLIVKNDQGEHIETFDELLIATGSIPQLAGIKCSRSNRVFVLKDLTDMEQIDNFIREHKPQKCAVIGGGYIGIEMLEAFAGRGIETHLLHRRKDLARTFEIEISDLVKEELVRNGITLNLELTIHEIKDVDEKAVIVTNKGDYEYDMVFLGLGVIPCCQLAAESGIQQGVKGSIAVNENLQTNYPYIYAAGDCAETTHILSKQPVYVPLALKANKEGMIAGRNIAGYPTAFPGVLGTAITKCFDLGVARTGLCYDEAVGLGMDPVKIPIKSRSKAGYYPGPKDMFSLVVAQKGTGLVLGAQLAGPVDAVKRIDVYATAIHSNMTLDDIFNLDLAYAPPFAPVYDPVLLAARVGKKAVE